MEAGGKRKKISGGKKGERAATVAEEREKGGKGRGRR